MRQVKAARARPARQLGGAGEQAPRLVEQAGAAMAADRGVLDPEAVAQRQRLREVPRGHLDLVARSRSSGSITGRSTSTCGELVRSTQTRTVGSRQAVARDRRDDLAGLLGAEHGADRQCDILGGQRVGDRQRGLIADERRHRRLAVQRHAVVAAGLHAGVGERAQQLVGARMGDDVQVPGRGRRRRERPGGRRGRPGRPRRRPRRRAGARRTSRRARAAGRAGSPPAARPGASCSRPARTSPCRASRGSAAPARSATSSSSVAIAPPSPKQPRFLEG